MIELNEVTRAFGRKTAVDRLTFTVRGGELFALLGPNGAGKTTTIKMLVGLLRPDGGTIRIDGVDVVAEPRRAVASLGYVPDEPFLYDRLSGRELLEFVGRMRGLSGETLAAAIARQSEPFALEAFLDDLIETYSHGMKQRLVFAAALLHAPRALVVDEPMVALDPRHVRVVKDLLRRQVAEGAAVLMSTHTLAIAEEIADRIAILDRGRLRFLGTVAELREASSAPHHSLETLFLELTDADPPASDAPPSAAPAGAEAAGRREAAPDPAASPRP